MDSFEKGNKHNVMQTRKCWKTDDITFRKCFVNTSVNYTVHFQLNDENIAQSLEYSGCVLLYVSSFLLRERGVKERERGRKRIEENNGREMFSNKISIIPVHAEET